MGPSEDSGLMFSARSQCTVGPLYSQQNIQSLAKSMKLPVNDGTNIRARIENASRVVLQAHRTFSMDAISLVPIELSPESFRKGWGPEVAYFWGKIILGHKNQVVEERGTEKRQDKRKPQRDREEERE